MNEKLVEKLKAIAGSKCVYDNFNEDGMDEDGDYFNAQGLEWGKL